MFHPVNCIEWKPLVEQMIFFTIKDQTIPDHSLSQLVGQYEGAVENLCLLYGFSNFCEFAFSAARMLLYLPLLKIIIVIVPVNVIAVNERAVICTFDP